MSWTWWPNDEVGNTQESKKESIAIFGSDNVFGTPKPERLMQRILHIATNPGDLVLDSFAGSGTTGAVAHKMGRRWIMIELGEHCETHIIPRMKKVINADDPGGITEVMEWQGGGGFRYYRLAPSLLEKDTWGNWVISREYNAAMLSEAVCKLMGFGYEPSDAHYWMHGRSSETDFIYVTTQSLTHEQLNAISEEVGEGRSLLVCCKAFRGSADAFANLTVRKIPHAVLRRCEWGRDDYSLNIANLPIAQPDPDEGEPKRLKRGRKSGAPQDDLFAKEAGK
jgi:adenine-specific DNA-methyltransferase